ncbi:hypothetical protein GGD83_003337 [Rhodoblastus sphagnicola]|nr:hypothetical protein [Rhodoblastus sphagnicola]
MDKLPAIVQMGHVFCVQYSVTGYPRELELSVIGAEKAIGHIKLVSERFGPRSVVWRYDPILITDLTPVDWHVENFASLASSLRGGVDEVVVSFAHFYQKTTRNLDASARTNGFRYSHPPDGEKLAVLSQLSDIARSEHIRLTVCAQPALIPPGAKAARCVDLDRLSDLRGRIVRGRESGNRPGCDCAQSIDIGDYDTCPHGCAYCYAVRRRALARQRHREHDPDGEFLVASGRAPPAPVEAAEQLKLF